MLSLSNFNLKWWKTITIVIILNPFSYFVNLSMGIKLKLPWGIPSKTPPTIFIFVYPSNFEMRNVNCWHLNPLSYILIHLVCQSVSQSVIGLGKGVLCSRELSAIGRMVATDSEWRWANTGGLGMGDSGRTMATDNYIIWFETF
jgi:hypothetical protein